MILTGSVFFYQIRIDFKWTYEESQNLTQIFISDLVPEKNMKIYWYNTELFHRKRRMRILY